MIRIPANCWVISSKVASGEGGIPSKDDILGVIPQQQLPLTTLEEIAKQFAGMRITNTSN